MHTGCGTFTHGCTIHGRSISGCIPSLTSLFVADDDDDADDDGFASFGPATSSFVDGCADAGLLDTVNMAFESICLFAMVVLDTDGVTDCSTMLEPYRHKHISIVCFVFVYMFQANRHR